MTNEQAKKMLKAKLECLKRETSGTDFDCNNSNCDECSLCYEQGNIGEQKEALDMAIKALEQQLRDCKTCKHSDNGNCAGTEECHECMWGSKYEQQPCEDCISRQAAIDALYDWSEHSMTDAEAWHIKQVIGDIKSLPSAQPEQRYTEEELRVFAHGISLSLLSKRSAQHWRYDKDTATEIEFLERLYDKVSADMKGGQG